MKIFVSRDDHFGFARELNFGAKDGKQYFVPVTPDITDAVY